MATLAALLKNANDISIEGHRGLSGSCRQSPAQKEQQQQAVHLSSSDRQDLISNVNVAQGESIGLRLHRYSEDCDLIMSDCQTFGGCAKHAVSFFQFLRFGLVSKSIGDAVLIGMKIHPKTVPVSDACKCRRHTSATLALQETAQAAEHHLKRVHIIR